jgi:hypothetical protein
MLLNNLDPQVVERPGDFYMVAGEKLHATSKAWI